MHITKHRQGATEDTIRCASLTVPPQTHLHAVLLVSQLAISHHPHTGRRAHEAHDRVSALREAPLCCRNMTGGTTRSDYPSGPLDDTPNSSAHRGDTATRDTTLHTHTTATLPPEELNDIQMSFTEIVPVVPEEKQSKQSQPNDTMDSADFSTLRTVAPPPQNCSVKETMEFVKYQLNRIGMETEILDGLLLLGAGRTERLEGGVIFQRTLTSTGYSELTMLKPIPFLFGLTKSAAVLFKCYPVS